MKRDEFAKVVANLEAWLKELESRLVDSKLRVAQKREPNKELEEELIMYKKKDVE